MMVIHVRILVIYILSREQVHITHPGISEKSSTPKVPAGICFSWKKRVILTSKPDLKAMWRGFKHTFKKKSTTFFRVHPG